MAYARKTGIKANDAYGDRMVLIRGKKGKLLLEPREADEILADLQVMYHERTLGVEYEEETWEPE